MIKDVNSDFETTFMMSLIGPFAFLGLLKQYDYLIFYDELNYLENLEYLVSIEENEILFWEIEFIRNLVCEIDIKYPNKV